MGPSLWVCTALAAAAVLCVCEGKANEEGEAYLAKLMEEVQDKQVRQVPMDDSFLYVREVTKGAPEGPTPNMSSPCNVSYIVRNTPSQYLHQPRALLTDLPNRLRQHKKVKKAAWQCPFQPCHSHSTVPCESWPTRWACACACIFFPAKRSENRCF